MEALLILNPAYGRKYHTGAEIVADWQAGKDFKISNGPYCSIRDFPVMKRDFEEIVLTWYDSDGFPHIHYLYNFWGGQPK